MGCQPLQHYFHCFIFLLSLRYYPSISIKGRALTITFFILTLLCHETYHSSGNPWLKERIPQRHVVKQASARNPQLRRVFPNRSITDSPVMCKTDPIQLFKKCYREVMEVEVDGRAKSCVLSLLVYYCMFQENLSNNGLHKSIALLVPKW